MQDQRQNISLSAIAKGHLEAVRMKITYLGEQTRPILTVILASTEQESSGTELTDFQAVQHIQKLYSNDRLPTVNRVKLPLITCRRILELLEQVMPKGQEPSSRPLLSFIVLVRNSTGFHGEEFLLDSAHGELLYSAIFRAFDDPARLPDALTAQFRRIFPDAKQLPR